MSKVVLYIAMSLDGYIADINGNVNWLGGDGSEPENTGSYTKFIQTIDTIILGWSTYHQIVTELSPDNWPYMGKTTYVVTHRSEESSQDIIFTSQNLETLITDMKKHTRKNIWICGGANLIQQLASSNLIDEYYISVIPTILSSGIRLFDNIPDQIKLKLVQTQTYNGIVDLVYIHRKNH